MKKNKDEKPADKASLRLEQFLEAREPVEEECEIPDDVENKEKAEKKAETKAKHSKKNQPPKPLKNNENTERKDHGD